MHARSRLRSLKLTLSSIFPTAESGARMEMLSKKASSGTLKHLQWAAKRPKSYGSFSEDDSAEIALPTMPHVPPPKDSEGSEWEEFAEEGTGNPYWFNARTGESRWEPPAGFAAATTTTSTRAQEPEAAAKTVESASARGHMHERSRTRSGTFSC